MRQAILTGWPIGLASALVFGAGCASPPKGRAAEVAAADVQPRYAQRHASESGAATRTPELTDDSGLPDYLAYAALNNPGLEAAFNEWKAAVERVPQVKALPDPRFTYRYYIREVETRVGPQRQSFGLSQTFPWFEKLALRGDVAAEEARAARQRYEDRKLRLFYRVKDAWYEYYYLRRAIDVVEENRDLLKYLEGVARVRYKVAAAGHPDVIRAQVELGKLDDRVRTLQDLRGPIVARLNAALNRPVKTPLPWPTSAPLEVVEATDDQMLTWLREASPELKALDYEVASHSRAIDLARKDYFPDVTLAVDYIDTREAILAGTPDSGKDPVVVGVSVNLPVWLHKYAAGVREAEARYWAALKAKADRENTLSSDLKMVLYRFRDAERKVDLYRDTLVPKARQSLKATEAAFRAAEATFTDLVDAERVLLEFELSHERALASHAQRLAELEALIGRDLPRTVPHGMPDAEVTPDEEADEPPAPEEGGDEQGPAGEAQDEPDLPGPIMPENEPIEGETR